MQNLHTLLESQMQFVSYVGDTEIVGAILVILVISYLLLKKRLIRALILTFTSISYVYSIYLKFLFRHERPDSALPKEYLIDLYSFPSTHVIVYTVVFGYILWLTFKSKKLDRLVVDTLRILCFYLIILVGASRIYLGEHWVIDVVAGYLFGLFFLLLIVGLDKKLHKVLPKYKK